MSVVSGVTLCMSVVEEEVTPDGPPRLLEHINEWLENEGGCGPLVRVEDYFGGNKHPQMFVAGGGFNAFLEDEFAAFVLSLPWENPDNVVLIIQPEEGKTRVFRPS